MRIDHCDSCGRPVFFENTKCLACGRLLGFFPERREVCSLDEAGTDLWRRSKAPKDETAYRLCANYRERNLCNWVVAADDPNPLCHSCRLTRVIPDLSHPGYIEAWQRLEVAKRRLIYSLLELQLPIRTKAENAEDGLAFEFLADAEPVNGEQVCVLTGHTDGVIVINIAEANDVEREKRRAALGEPYRTLLGHFRHEIGHYYWDRLIAKSPLLGPYREHFGDESADYSKALEHHYKDGPPPDWNQRFISAYATSHPWEDWAETWAHYLHMVDSVETARSFGITGTSGRGPMKTRETATANAAGDVFHSMLDDWFALTCALNNLNRGLGMPDAYPFVLTAPVIDKLAFVHRAIREPRVRTTPTTPTPAGVVAAPTPSAKT